MALDTPRLFYAALRLYDLGMASQRLPKHVYPNSIRKAKTSHRLMPVKPAATTLTHTTTTINSKIASPMAAQTQDVPSSMSVIICLVGKICASTSMERPAFKIFVAVSIIAG